MEAMFSFTIKINGDLFTVRGNTIEEFKSNIVAADSAIEMLGQLQGAPMAVIGARQNVKAAVNGESVSSVKTATLPNYNFLEDVEEAIESSDETVTDEAVEEITINSSTRSCKHGERKYIEGVSKRGKPYKGYFCQA